MKIINKVPQGEVFEYEFNIPSLIFFILNAGLLIFFVWVAVARDQFDRSFFFIIWPYFWGYLLAVAMHAFNRFSFVVDDDGLYRMFLGRVWRYIRWDEIEVIREFSSYSKVEKADVLVLHILPKSASFYSFTICRKIVVTEQIGDFYDLINLLNKYVKKYQIKTEIKINGRWQSIEKLSISIEG